MDMDLYSWLKVLHIVAVISWMAGLLYLPRLFVYHTEVVSESCSAIFKRMEQRLLKYIMTPAMILVWISGLCLAWEAHLFRAPWLHWKLLFVLFLSSLHGFCVRCTKKFAADGNTYSPSFYRILNEVPALTMIVIVILVVGKPF